MKEHLKEIRSLRQRLEDSIQTNDRLRQQLEERLAHTTTEKGNIHIHTRMRTHTGISVISFRIDSLDPEMVVSC